MLPTRIAAEDAGRRANRVRLEDRVPGGLIRVGLSAGTFAFSPDDKELVVTGNSDGIAVAFDTASGAEIARLAGKAPEVSFFTNQIWQTAGLAFLDEHHLAIGSVADTITIVDPATLKSIGNPIKVPPNSAKELFALDGGTGLLSSGRNGVERVEVATGKVVWQLDTQDITEAGCSRLAVVPEREHFYCGDGSGRLEERSIRDGSRSRELDEQNGAAGSRWPTRHGTELVSFGSSERVVSRWRLDGSGPITRRVAPGLTPLQYSPSGTSLISRLPVPGSINDPVDGAWVLLDPSTGRITQRLGAFNPAFWNTDNELGGVIITAQGLQQGAYYRLDAHRILPIDLTFTRRITHNVTNAGQPRLWLALLNDDGTFDIWTLERRPSARRIGPVVTVKSLVGLGGSPDGHHFAVTTTTGVQVYDSDTGAETARIDNRPDLRGVYFVDNNLLAVSSLGGELTLYDVDTLTPVRTLNGSRGFVQDVQPTLDGSMIAVDGGDRTVQLIDVATGTPVGGAITMSNAEWNGDALQLQGRELAVGGGTPDGIAIWDLDPQHWINAACHLAGRNLTTAEWDTYLGSLADYHATCP